MSISVSCECGARFNAPPHLAGKRVKCPKCSAAISIPAVAEPAKSAAAPQQARPKATAPQAPSPPPPPAPRASMPPVPQAPAASQPRQAAPAASQGPAPVAWNRVNIGMKVIAVGILFGFFSSSAEMLPLVGQFVSFPVEMITLVIQIVGFAFCLSLPMQNMSKALVIGAIASTFLGSIISGAGIAVQFMMNSATMYYIALTLYATGGLLTALTMALFFFGLRQGANITGQAKAAKNASMLAAGHATLAIVAFLFSIISMIVFGLLLNDASTRSYDVATNSTISEDPQYDTFSQNAEDAMGDTVRNFAIWGFFQFVFGIGMLLIGLTLTVFSLIFLFSHNFAPTSASYSRKPSSAWA